MKKHKTINLISIAALVTTSIILAVVFYWLVVTPKTADIVEPINVMNENNQVARGEPILLELKITKYASYPVTSSRTMTCGTRLYAFTAQSTSLPVGTFTRVIDNIIMPDDVNVGDKCVIRFENQYKVNPIRVIINDWYSESFTVKE